MTELIVKRCIPCEGGMPALDREAVKKLLLEVPHWDLSESGDEIVRTFQFKNYYHTIAFVNAIAWMAHKENHHPDMEVGFNRCLVRYSTHAINGLSENDFICASKVDALFTGSNS
ncbi:MAG: 4a-hydroxytetrahydrobiopterin dehydratase [Gammaproteobacteria bacterium]